MKKIEEYFAKIDGVDTIFDPIPTFDGDWVFSIDNLEKNSLINKDTKDNLLLRFVFDTYIKPLSKIFKTATNNILKFNIYFVSTPKEDKTQGRTLRYSKSRFFKDLLSFFNQNLDREKRTIEEHNKKLIDLFNNIVNDHDALIQSYCQVVKEKLEKIKDLQVKELNSIYYEYAFKDYEEQSKIIQEKLSFKEYLNNLETIFIDLYNGLLTLGDFFLRDIDVHGLYKCFDPDTFYLLFAKIIYDFNVEFSEKHNSLYANFAYLMHYQDALQELVKEDKKYSPMLKDYITNKGIRIHSYNRWMFMKELTPLLEKHPNIRKIPFPLDKEYGRNIPLIEKIYSLYNSEEIKLNWDVLPKGEGKKRGSVLKSSNKVSIDEDLVNETNMRIDIMSNSKFLGYPIPGLNSFAGYYAYIYPNGIVILEKYWANENFKPATGNATYVMNIDNFIEKSKWSKTSLMEYIKLTDSKDVRRIFHEGINRWQDGIYREINKETSYNYEDVINFIDKLQREALEEDERSL